MTTKKIIGFGIAILGAVAIMLTPKIPINPIYYEPTWMDSPQTQDKCLSHPCLVSQHTSTPSSKQQNQAVAIVAHGYSASSFETDELTTALRKNGILVSQIVLNAHGRDIDTFKESKWTDWGTPILDEYQKLRSAGYTNISLIGISASGTLMLQSLASNAFGSSPPQHIILVDPFIVPGAREIYLVPYIGFIFGNFPAAEGRSEIKKANWYNNNPAPTVRQLVKLVSSVRRELRRGITLPKDTTLTIYQSDKDPVSNPTGAQLVKSAITPQRQVTLINVPSKYHVFLQSKAQKSWSNANTQVQKKAFSDISKLIQTR